MSRLLLEAHNGGSLPTNDNPSPTLHDRARARVVELVVRGHIGPGDGAALCERIRELLAEDRPPSAAAAHCVDVVCNVAGVTDADIGTVNALARLQLTARRMGATLWLRRPTRDLRRLLRLAGLREVVPCWPGSGVEARRKPEHREEPGGVEEEGDAADPVP